MKRSRVMSLAAVFVLGVVSVAIASWTPDVIAKVKELKELANAKKEMPATISGVKNITGQELKAMMDGKKKVIVSDNRVKEQFDAERIKGADWLLADHLVADPKLADKYAKDDVIVLYCNGITCWRSPAAAVMLQNLGYKNLYWYRDGLPDWKKNKFPTE